MNGGSGRCIKQFEILYVTQPSLPETIDASKNVTINNVLTINEGSNPYKNETIAQDQC